MRRPSLPHRLGLVALALILLAGCANQTRRADAANAGIDDPEMSGPMLDPGIWRSPLGPDAAELTENTVRELAFAPIVPGLEGASGAFVDSSEEYGTLASAAWAFESGAHGRFILVETPSGAIQEQIEAPAQRPAGCEEGEPLPEEPESTVIRCTGEGFSVVPLPSVNARGVEGDQAVSITWIVPAPDPSEELAKMFEKPVVEITLMGPAEETDIKELVEIAGALGY